MAEAVFAKVPQYGGPALAKPRLSHPTRNLNKNSSRTEDLHGQASKTGRHADGAIREGGTLVRGQAGRVVLAEAVGRLRMCEGPTSLSVGSLRFIMPMPARRFQLRIEIC